MSIGGSRACRPRANTDLPVPRPPRDHHTAQPRVDGRQQKGQLQRPMARDRCQRKGTGGLIVFNRYSGCHHGRVSARFVPASLADALHR